jgi:hypothetical protein
MSSYEIKGLEPSGYSRWDEFVNHAPDGTFYHLSGWRKLIENQLRHSAYYLYCESGDVITGVLPLVRVKSWLFGDALVSVPFLVYGRKNLVSIIWNCVTGRLWKATGFVANPA